jgi:aminoglycoside phosphotransferase (APT) family kinase protein
MALPALETAEAAAEFRGGDLLHGDVKSGNVCLLGERTVLVDWNWAVRGNGLLDLATWLPSLHDEGGPAPETILPGQAPLAAAVAGGLALRASKPAPTQFPNLRIAQTRRLKRALPWACRLLGIDAPRCGGTCLR